MTQKAYETYREMSLGQGIPISEQTEQEYLTFLRQSMQENPLTMNRYFHYRGFLDGISVCSSILNELGDKSGRN